MRVFARLYVVLPLVSAVAACHGYQSDIARSGVYRCNREGDCAHGYSCRYGRCYARDWSGAICGDGRVGGDERCDDGVNDGTYGHCARSCSAGPSAFCGDGRVNGPEACDDGINDGRYSGCTPGCQRASRCGDGTVDLAYEGCDDGSGNGTDDATAGSCTADCRITAWPAVSVDTVVRVGEREAALSLFVDAWGVPEGTFYGVCTEPVGTSGEPLCSQVPVSADDVALPVSVNDLDPGTAYILRGYVENRLGRTFSDDVSILTLPPPVTDLTASAGTRSDGVALAWSTVPSATSYDIYRGDTWLQQVTDTTFLDTHAPWGNIAVGEAAASDGTSYEAVALTLAEATVTPAAPADYSVRARNAAGQSREASVRGFRGVGELSLAWEWSDRLDGDYKELESETSAPAATDVDAAGNGTPRYYRCRVNAAGAQTTFSNADRGYRGTRMPILAELRLRAITTSEAEVVVQVLDIGVPAVAPENVWLCMSADPDLDWNDEDAACAVIAGLEESEGHLVATVRLSELPAGGRVHLRPFVNSEMGLVRGTTIPLLTLPPAPVATVTPQGNPQHDTSCLFLSWSEVPSATAYRVQRHALDDDDEEEEEVWQDIALEQPRAHCDTSAPRPASLLPSSVSAQGVAVDASDAMFGTHVALTWSDIPSPATAGATVFYRVRAVNATGDGPWVSLSGSWPAPQVIGWEISVDGGDFAAWESMDPLERRATDETFAPPPRLRSPGTISLASQPDGDVRGIVFVPEGEPVWEAGEPREYCVRPVMDSGAVGEATCDVGSRGFAAQGLERTFEMSRSDYARDFSSLAVRQLEDGSYVAEAGAAFGEPRYFRARVRAKGATNEVLYTTPQLGRRAWAQTWPTGSEYLGMTGDGDWVAAWSAATIDFFHFSDGAWRFAESQPFPEDEGPSCSPQLRGNALVCSCYVYKYEEGSWHLGHRLIDATSYTLVGSSFLLDPTTAVAPVAVGDIEQGLAYFDLRTTKQDLMNRETIRFADLGLDHEPVWWTIREQGGLTTLVDDSLVLLLFHREGSTFFPLGYVPPYIQESSWDAYLLDDGPLPEGALGGVGVAVEEVSLFDLIDLYRQSVNYFLSRSAFAPSAREQDYLYLGDGHMIVLDDGIHVASSLGGVWRIIQSETAATSLGLQAIAAGSHAITLFAGAITSYRIPERPPPWRSSTVVDPPNADDSCGEAVDLDADHLLVGCPTLGATGAAFVYDASDGFSVPMALRTDTELWGGYRFGDAVAVSGDWAAVFCSGCPRSTAYLFFQTSPQVWTPVRPESIDPADFATANPPVLRGPWLGLGQHLYELVDGVWKIHSIRTVSQVSSTAPLVFDVQIPPFGPRVYVYHNHDWQILTEGGKALDVERDYWLTKKDFERGTMLRHTLVDATVETIAMPIRPPGGVDDIVRAAAYDDTIAVVVRNEQGQIYLNLLDGPEEIAMEPIAAISPATLRNCNGRLAYGTGNGQVVLWEEPR